MSILNSLLSNFRDFVTSRGFKYHYYFSAPSAGKLTLLFVHGFPSLAIDWHNQISYFRERGYGLVVPDQLGYGGTDKPTETRPYVHTGLARDLVDILDHEEITNVVAIGHDWGSKTTSVLANLYSDRFIGFGFLAVGYVPPATEPVPEAALDQVLGYWKFFTAPDANEVVKEHIESFYDLVYAKDARLWKFNMSPANSTRIFIESDTRTPRVPFAYDSNELWKYHKQEFEKNGFDAPFNFYRVASGEIEPEDSKQIPLDNYRIQKPVFFGGDATEDALGMQHIQEAQTRQFCSDVTVVNFNTTHWAPEEAPDAANEALEEWLSTLTLA